ncbi:HNH endonuclease [Archangium violaceum]|uniref:HNH endonuclease n=1 Tax=Archangium violaceum TaxID=83451 RepID=UPI00190F6AAC|nr:HNH endonuclease [Archangium violaceum]
MNTISGQGVRAAYEVAKRVYLSVMSETSGVRKLVQQKAMSKSSALNYIRNFQKMCLGQAYHYTINAEATRYFLEHIRDDFGAETATRAVCSVRAHLVRYRNGRPGQLKDVEAICDEFERGLLSDEFQREQNAFLEAVLSAQRSSEEERQLRLASAPRKPRRKLVQTVAYERNPDVVAEVLARANGLCEGCRQSAPFIRASDGTPYLEVHHCIRLADEGEDTVENAIALCPNCHRKAHFGSEDLT